MKNVLFSQKRPFTQPFAWKRAVVLLSFLLLRVPDIQAGEILEQMKSDSVLVLTWENDGFSGGGDSDYTQGLKLTYLQDYAPVPENGFKSTLANAVSLGMYEPGYQRFGLSVGQSIFTPEKLGRRSLIRDDRPYAGWLYFGLNYQHWGSINSSTMI